MEKLNLITIQNYQNFNSVEEMDKAVHRFLWRHEAELSAGALSVLHVIWELSSSIIGVSYARNDYIAEQANVSRRTVIRSLNIFQQKGFIKKIPTIKENGKQGVNLLVIQPICD